MTRISPNHQFVASRLAVFRLGLVLGAFAWGWSAAAADWPVAMVDFAFSPKDIAIEMGDTVTWSNVGQSHHDAASGTNRVPSGLWASALLPNGESFSFTFTNVPPGGYGYYCTPHVFNFGMIGSVTVRPPNLPPTVAITNPVDGTVVAAGSSVLIGADAADADGTVTQVQFVANGLPIGAAQTRPFAVTLAAPPPATYALQAIAIDNRGGTATSAVVHLTFNLAPTVAITTPVSGQVFLAGANVPVEAVAADADGIVSQVEFFTNGFSAAVIQTPPYTFILSNNVVGDYLLSAVATDDRGATSASPAVIFTVITPPSLPTILTQPVSQTNVIGNDVQFSVLAVGTAPLMYQWRFNGTDLGGATGTALQLLAVRTNDSGIYSVVITNVAGAVTGSASLLITLPADIPPVVSLTEPTNGARYPAHADVTISADAHDPDGTITQVEFFSRTTSFQTNSIGVAVQPPFSVILSNLAQGTHFVFARATDDRGGTADSGEAHFTGQEPAVVILIRSPAAPALALGTEVTLTATNGTTGPAFTNVEFFADAMSLGRSAAAPFTIVWQPTEPRTYSLTAVATDDLGQTNTSAPISVRLFTPELERPTIKITDSPRNLARLTSPLVSLAGVAGDNIGLDHVEYRLNNGPAIYASGLTSWNFQVSLPAGPNTIRVRSVDLAGNPSLEVTRFFTYVAQERLAVEVHGSGAAQPDLNGRVLEIGQMYRMAGRPAAGQIFAGWQGASSSNSAVLSFVMQSNLTLVLNFVPNPFLAVAGNYAGLFAGTDSPGLDNSGSINLHLGKLGSFSGKLVMNRSRYSFRGKFDASGRATFSVLRRSLPPVALVMQLDLETNPGQLDGQVNGVSGTNRWTASLTAQRNASREANPAPPPSPYAFMFTSVSDAVGQVVGRGLAKVGGAGRVQFVGTLTGGEKFALFSTLEQADESPLYLSFNGSRSAIIGWVSFASATNPPPTGQLYRLSDATDGASLLEITPSQ